MWACMYVHTAWASVLLFGTKGNTRASKCGTAIVQSRFLCINAMRLYESGQVALLYDSKMLVKCFLGVLKVKKYEKIL